MGTNLLISFPSLPTRCFQINDSYFNDTDNEAQELFYQHNCELEDHCRNSYPCLKGDIYHKLISELYNIDIAKFFLVINGGRTNTYDNHTCSETSDDGDNIQFKDEININVSFRLLGGKGGFGKILKSQAKKKSQSNNLDSCRNLQGQRIRTVRLNEQMNRWREQQSNQENLDKDAYKVPKHKDSSDTTTSETFNDEKYVETVEKETTKVKETVLRGFDQKLNRESQELKLNEELESKRSNVLDACLDVYDL